MAEAIAAPPTPNSSVKMNMGSKIIFIIVPRPATAIGSFISPSPDNMDRKNVEKTIKGSPIRLIFK